ncbi:MAG: F0F1 ATP synthase subunit A [Myxococcales bacterium]|nr:F0F1 ATP synthase subunit A [Myxococcales bacterium]
METPHPPLWLEHVPGYQQMAGWIESFGHGWFFDSQVHVQHVAAILLVSLVMLIFALFARWGLEGRESDILPDDTLTARNAMELFIEGLLSVMQSAMSREAAIRHLWFIMPMAMFILFSNLLGLIPGFLPPTESFNTTFACATLVFIYYNAYGLYRLGGDHFVHMANPVGESWGWLLAPIFFPIELISHAVRPISLSVRLLCNIAGDHLVLGVFVGLAATIFGGLPLFLPIPFMALGLFVALVQTFVFTLLSCVYIGEVENNIAHHMEAH